MAGIWLASIVAACASGATPAAAPSPTSVTGQSPFSPTTKSEPRWQDELEKLKAAAVKEGSLLIYGSSGAAVRDPVTKVFKEKYGVNLEWVSGRLGEVMQKVLMEQRSGIYNGDVYLSGATGIFLVKQTGVENAFQRLDPLLFLPEVLDKKAWWGGDLIFLDEEHSWAAFLAFPQPYIFINTELVKPGEVKGWKDVLDPKWKGKIVLYNPRDGAGLDWAYSVSEVVMGRDYLRQFIKQEPIILGDSRQQCEWVARGKYPIAVAARTENMNEFVTLGAPVKIVSPSEGVHLISSAGGVSAFRNAPHPAATKLFINWSLTKEGGTLLSRLVGGQSARLDVPTDFLDQSMVRQPGGKYFNTITGEHYSKKQEFSKVAIEMFSPLMK